ncbi:MAG: hypothetical protein ACLQBJ_14850 [Bryobacteraceae bacterium]
MTVTILSLELRSRKLPPVSSASNANPTHIRDPELMRMNSTPSKNPGKMPNLPIRLALRADIRIACIALHLPNQTAKTYIE